jgi:uncharacterized protein YbjT (DUF2867 family)
MNILLCGATGFIGRNVTRALLSAGYKVAGTSSSAQTPEHARQTLGLERVLPVDFARDTNPSVWLPRLAGIDAVVNAVGVLRDSRQRPIQAVHTDTPRALFEACAQAGVRKVVQISALGIDRCGAPYATTKLAAERHLLGLRAQGKLDAVVLRPSIVFGAHGDSSQLFMALARSPLLVLPQAMIDARIQPVAVSDLAQAVALLFSPQAPLFDSPLPCVGPTALSLADFINSLRTQLGHGPAHVLPLPRWATQLGARIGDHVPASPFCSDTLELLRQDNVAPVEGFAELLGRMPVAHQDLVRTAWL